MSVGVSRPNRMINTVATCVWSFMDSTLPSMPENGPERIFTESPTAKSTSTSSLTSFNKLSLKREKESLKKNLKTMRTKSLKPLNSLIKKTLEKSPNASSDTSSPKSAPTLFLTQSAILCSKKASSMIMRISIIENLLNFGEKNNF